MWSSMQLEKTTGRPEISAEDMLADPEKVWRYMKMACGENAKRVYGRLGRDFGPFSRLGEAWYFRYAFERASALVAAQNDWCDAANQFGAESMGMFERIFHFPPGCHNLRTSKDIR